MDLSQGDEDAAELQLVGAFNDLINGILHPSSAAKTVDRIISDECRRGAARYEAASADEKESVDTSGIAGWQKYLYVDLLATAAMMVPAGDPGHDRLVKFVRALNDLPRHTVPRVLPDGSIDEKELWLITPETDYDGLRQWLWEVIEGGAKPYGRDYDPKFYVNLSAFLALLLASGTAAMLRFSALLDPFARRSLVAVASQNPEAYAFQIAAAAQWILHGGEAILDMCQKRAMAVKRWTPELWSSLRTKFDTVANDPRFTAEGCGWAAKARDRMDELEEKDLSFAPGVVETFGFNRPSSP